MLWLRSGGIAYHFKALWNQKKWNSYQAWCSKNVLDFIQSSPKPIVLIGTSGGYSLDLKIFKNYPHQISVLEPDPIARLIFSWRAKKVGLQVKYLKKKYFHYKKKSGLSIEGLESLKKDTKNKKVIFTNLLGQFLVEFGSWRDDVFSKEWIDGFQSFFNTHDVLSYHDRLSFSLSESLDQCFDAPTRLRDEELMNQIDAKAKKLTVYSHGTWELFPENMHSQYFLWSLTKKNKHWIELLFKKV